VQKHFSFRELKTAFELNNRDVPDSFRGTAFAASKRGSFFQEAPRLRNQFSGDLFLQSYLKRILPNEVELLIYIFDVVNSFNTRVSTVSFFFSIILIYLSLFSI